MANVEITDGSHVSAGVTADKELRVITAPYPPFTEQRVQPFRQYFTDDGTATGTTDIGSTVSGEFYIPANSNNDRYITTINFIVGFGATAQPYQWCDGVAFAAGNGIRLWYENRRGEHDIHDDIRSNQDMLGLGFNSVTSAWLLRGLISNNDYGYYVTVDLTKMGLSFGIKLDAGTDQRLRISTTSDVKILAADLFTAVGFGFERFA